MMEEHNEVLQDNTAAAEAIANHGDHVILGNTRTHGKVIGIQDVLDSNIYVKEGSAMQFQSPRAYIEPWLEAVGAEPTEIAVATSKKVSNIDPDSNVEHLSFGRVAVEYNLGTDVPEFDTVLGMVFALDTGRPQFKVYSGRNAHACTNLCIFNADHVYSHDMVSDFRSVFTKSKEYRDKTEAEAVHFTEVVERMKNTQLSKEQMHEKLGDLLMESQNNSLGVTPIVGAAKFLGDQKSRYFAPNGCTEWNMYNAVTQVFTDQKHNIFEKPTKTVMLSNMFGLTSRN